MWFPGQLTTFRVKPLGAAPSALTLKTTLNGKTAETPLVADGRSSFEAQVHRRASRAGSTTASCAGARCSDAAGGGLADDAAPVRVEQGGVRAVGRSSVPGPPSSDGYVWNILEPEILTPDYDALAQTAPIAWAPMTITKADDYGELKRHEWEFQHHSAFAYGHSVAGQADRAGLRLHQPERQSRATTPQCGFG